MKTELITTEDNSKSLRNIELDETYHSSHGAIQESVHIFIEAGLKQISKPVINILEIGFGTGLNAILSLNEAIEKNYKINFTTIEKYPITKETASLLNYPELINPKIQEEFQKLHSCGWDNKENIHNQFSITKNLANITDFNYGNNIFDIVFFDAFSPKKQPELWSSEVFKRIFDAMKPDGILTTYCCQGQVKRNLLSVGFKIKKLPGPPGKREFLKATK